MMHSDKNVAGYEGEKSFCWPQEVLNRIEKKRTIMNNCNCNCWWSRKWNTPRPSETVFES